MLVPTLWLCGAFYFNVSLAGAEPVTEPVSKAMTESVSELVTEPVAESGKTFKNSQGVEFLPVPGKTALMAVWETRVQDYSMFVKAMKRPWPKANFSQTGMHPVVNVSWEDAKAYAQWLTQKERAAGVLPQGWRYRLPFSEEWGLAAGLPAYNDQAAPDQSLYTHFPWQGDWPPVLNGGNYHPSLGVDSYEHTAPVGSFKPNSNGFYDLGGNVWEWCEDVYNQSPDYRVLRGASWRMRDPGDLLTATVIGNRPSLRLSVYGFRLVIEKQSDPS
jgi:formylglycine-generating enzyme required for sulfatase activity